MNKNDCTHDSLEKDFYLGSDTGDYKCQHCGEVGYGKNWPERERAEKEERDKKAQ